MQNHLPVMIMVTTLTLPEPCYLTHAMLDVLVFG